MVALIAATVLAVGWMAYRNMNEAIVPRALERVKIELRPLTTELESYVRGARQDVTAFRSAAAIAGIVRANEAGGVDPKDGIAEAVWRQRMAERFAAELEAKPAYDKFRIISFADGRELLRVDRSGPDHVIRIVPGPELVDKSDRGYFKSAIRLAASDIYVSPIVLKRTMRGGEVAVPHVPVLRVAAIIPGELKPFGMVLIDVNMAPILREIAASGRPGGEIYVVDEFGNYLVHPDPQMAFGTDLGRPTHWQQDFPDLVAGFMQEKPEARLIVDPAGAKAFAGVSSVRLADGPRVGILTATPRALIMAPAAAIGRAILLVGAIAILCAAGLAALVARSLTGPLVQMTAAVDAFPHDRSAALPIDASGEIGVLAQAFNRAMAEVKDKTASLESEVQEHRRTEAELKRHIDRERLFGAAVNSSQDVVVTMTPDGLVTGWNPAAAKLFGWTSDEMCGRNIDAIVPDDRRTEVRSILEKIRRGETVNHHETVRLTKDRRPIEVSLSVSPIRAPSGELIGACKIARDITASNQAKALLERESGERRRVAEILDNIVTTMSDAVLVADRNGKILLSNPAAQRLLGITPGMTTEQWPQGYEIFVPDQSMPLPWQDGPLMRAVRGEMVANVDVGIRHRDNRKTLSLVANGGPIQHGMQRNQAGIVVYHDVTAAKEAERQLRHSQKMEALGQLTGGIAHDFNNVLTVITGTVGILAEGVAAKPELAEIVQMIDDAAERGGALTSHLLAFSRRQPLEPRATDVNTLITEASRLLRPTLGEHIEIETLVNEPVSAAMIDPAQLTTAILNLALNARDAMPDGGKLILEAHDIVLDDGYAASNADVVAGSYVLIAVSDTGTGIPADIVEKVFDPFFTTKEVGKGTGLGLSMVYGFVKQSGGNVKIYSEPGYGTTIRMYLPRATGQAQELFESMEDETIQSGHETVLVVEDDALVRKYVVAQIMALGYTTLAAAGSVEALSLIDGRDDIDLLFTDIVMPGTANGRDLAEAAIKRRPSLKVLYTSGYTEDAIVHHGRLDPGVLLLAKPYRRSDLARMLRLALDSPAAPQQSRAHALKTA
ncbi:MAG TPA: PAS domain S-box protein [Xanthobacteraceae bacterium]|jgi:PAS domain S-box-containing protein|nr:PAS domain S-box protein [Xanthobacteraceae bacterium]